MIITVVISMLFVFLFVFCSKKPKNTAKSPGSSLASNPAAATPVPATPAKPTIVDREDRDSTRTKAGNRKVSMMKEPDSVDDAFKNLAAKLKAKGKADATGADSLIGDDDENPMANFCMPERPVVEKNQDGAKLANIVEMQEKKPEKKEKKVDRGPQTTAKEPSVVTKTVEMSSGKRKKKATETKKTSEMKKVSEKKVSKMSKMEKMAKTDSTQSDPLGVDVTQDEEKEDVEDVEMSKTQAQATSTTKTMMLPTIRLSDDTKNGPP